MSPLVCVERMRRVQALAVRAHDTSQLAKQEAMSEAVSIHIEDDIEHIVGERLDHNKDRGDFFL